MPHDPLLHPLYTSPRYGTVPTLALDQNPFVAASQVTNQTLTNVSEQFNWAKDWADEELTTAVELINDLVIYAGHVPQYPPGLRLPDLDITPDWESIALDPVSVADFGEIAVFPETREFSVEGLPSVGSVTIPPFETSVPGIVIPNVPPPDLTIIRPGAVPENPGFTFPPEVTVSLPPEPTLTPVNIPKFTAPVLAEFSTDFPTFTEQFIDTSINWTEPTYTREVIDGIIAQVQVFLAGGSGIDTDVEEAIFFRGNDRESRAIRRNVQQATDEWAGKGYTAPPGMLVQRIDNIREEGLTKALSFNREMTIKVFDTEIENLRFAVTQGIVAEQLFVTLFLAATERLFEVQKLAIQWRIDLYNITVTIFNAAMQEVELRVRVYEAQIRTQLAEIEIFKAQIDAERAKAEVNKVLVEAYTAQIQARIALVEMYKAQVQAVGIQAEVFSTEVRAYGEEVDAYAARIGADKLRYEAYDSQIRGELGKASIVESEARAYAAEIEGINTGVKAEVAVLEGGVSKIQVEIQAFVANLQAVSEKAKLQLAQIQANIGGYTADTQRYIAQASEEEAKARVALAGWESKNRTALDYYGVQVQKFGVDQSALLENSRMSLTALSSAAEISSTIGAGALAAMHVGMTMSGTGGLTASGSVSEGYTHSESVSDSNTQTSSVEHEEVKDFVTDEFPMKPFLGPYSS